MVIDSGSASEAEVQLGLTQSAVSKSIRALEAELGVPLFEHAPSALVPTAFSQPVVDYARCTLDDLDRLRRRLSAQLRSEVETIRIGLDTSIPHALVEVALVAMKRRHPCITLRLEVMRPTPLKDALLAGSLDVGIASASWLVADVRVVYEQIGEEPLIVLASCRSDCARSAESLAELWQCRWVLPGTLDFIRSTMRDVFASDGKGDPKDLLEADTSHASRAGNFHRLSHRCAAGARPALSETGRTGPHSSRVDAAAHEVWPSLEGAQRCQVYGF